MISGADKKNKVITILLLSASVTLFIQLWAKGKVINNLRFNLAVTQRELRQSSQQLRRRNAELTKVAKELKTMSETSRSIKQDLEEERNKKGGCELCQEEKDSLEKRYEDTLIVMAEEKQEIVNKLKKTKSENKELSSQISALTDLKDKDKRVIEVLKASLSKLNLDETFKDAPKEKFRNSQTKDENETKMKNTVEDHYDSITFQKQVGQEVNDKIKEDEVDVTNKELGEQDSNTEYDAKGSEQENGVITEELTAGSHQQMIKADSLQQGMGEGDRGQQQLTGDENTQQNQKQVRFHRRRGHIVKKRKN